MWTVEQYTLIVIILLITCLFFPRWAREETGEKKQTKTLNLSKVRTKMLVCYCFVPPINVDHVMMLKEVFSPCSCTRITHWCGMVTQWFTVYIVTVEACVAEWLTPRTPDLEVRGSSVARRVVSLGKELYSTWSLFTQVYKWVLATYCWGVTLRWTSIPYSGE